MFEKVSAFLFVGEWTKNLAIRIAISYMPHVRQNVPTAE